jgi:hypothetical protein
MRTVSVDFKEAKPLFEDIMRAEYQLALSGKGNERMRNRRQHIREDGGLTIEWDMIENG